MNLEIIKEDVMFKKEWMINLLGKKKKEGMKLKKSKSKILLMTKNE